MTVNISLVSISLYLSYLSYEKHSQDRYNFKLGFHIVICRTKKIHRTDTTRQILSISFYLVQQVVSVVLVLSICTGGSIKLYLSYELFSYDRHDRYNDMETRLNGNLPYKCSIQQKRQIQLVVRDRMNSICPMNFFRTTDTTGTTIWKPGYSFFLQDNVNSSVYLCSCANFQTLSATNPQNAFHIKKLSLLPWLICGKSFWP